MQGQLCLDLVLLYHNFGFLESTVWRKFIVALRFVLLIEQAWFFFIFWGVTKSLGTAATSGLLYRPQMIDEGDCGAIGGMKIEIGRASCMERV
jgi:hypothetical protein